jgi:hypothetical protein
MRTHTHITHLGAACFGVMVGITHASPGCFLNAGLVLWAVLRRMRCSPCSVALFFYANSASDGGKELVLFAFSENWRKQPDTILRPNGMNGTP